MKDLSRLEAHKLLEDASKRNPGKWVDHTINVAKIVGRLAENLGLDKEKAYVYGLMHDIGRREGIRGAVHIVDGYNYLKSLGYEDIGRYCLTHSYYIKNVYTILPKMDMSEEQIEFVQNYLDKIEYDLYDRIIQIGDCMATAECIASVERRVLDSYIRYGVNEYSVGNWKAIFGIQNEIEEKLGYSMYRLFPEVLEDMKNQLIKDVVTF